MTQWQSSKPSVPVRSLLSPLSRRHACNYLVQATMMETYDRKVVEFLPKLLFFHPKLDSQCQRQKEIYHFSDINTHLLIQTDTRNVSRAIAKKTTKKEVNVFVLPIPLLLESSLNTVYTIFPFSKVILIIPLLRSPNSRRTVNLIQLSTSHVWPGNDA